MFDDTFLKKMKALACQEKKVKMYKGLVRAKGKIIVKSKTKNDNIRLRVQKGEKEYKIHVKDTKNNINTKIKRIAKPDDSRQSTLSDLA